MKRHIKYGDPECSRAVFNKGRKISGKDPNEWRKCAITGVPIKFSDLNKNIETGWHQDHFISKAKNGSDELRNLIPVQKRQNIGQGASLKDKPKALLLLHRALAEQRGIKPIYKNLEFKWGNDLIGKTLWVKATPTSIQKLAILNHYNRKMVNITWVDTKWEDDLPLNKDLFEELK